MIEYEVNLAVASDLDPVYRPWLREHITRMLSLPGFIDATLTRVLEPDCDPCIEYCVRYRLCDRAALATYLDTYAQTMRGDGLARFGDRVRARRRVLTVLADHAADDPDTEPSAVRAPG